MKRRSILICLFLMLVALQVGGATYYATRYNNFGSLTFHETIEDDYLILENNLWFDMMSLDTTLLQPGTGYRFYARFASKHNTAGRSYAFSDINGHKQRTSNPVWGIVFNYIDDLDYYSVTLQCANSALHDDVTDQRSITVTLNRVLNGKVDKLEQKTLYSGFSLEDDFNVLGVDVNGSNVEVKGGKNSLEHLFNVEIETTFSPTQVGVMAGKGAKITLERSVLSINSQQAVKQSTGWTRNSLDAHFAATTNPIEGYWTYLDREMEDSWLKLGGKYTVALVETGDDEYDIIYVSGAQVNPEQWKEGMLKGHLSRTIFTDTYKGMWVDAMLEPITEDVQATIEGAVILCMKFPVYKSQVRFSREY